MQTASDTNSPAPNSGTCHQRKFVSARRGGHSNWMPARMATASIEAVAIVHARAGLLSISLLAVAIVPLSLPVRLPTGLT